MSVSEITQEKIIGLLKCSYQYADSFRNSTFSAENPRLIEALVNAQSSAIEINQEALIQGLIQAISNHRWLMSHLASTPNNQRAVLSVLYERWFSLKYASDELRNNRVIVLAAVNVYGMNLRYASEAHRSDREVVLAAVNQ